MRLSSDARAQFAQTRVLCFRGDSVTHLPNDDGKTISCSRYSPRYRGIACAWQAHQPSSGQLFSVGLNGGACAGDLGLGWLDRCRFVFRSQWISCLRITLLRAPKVRLYLRGTFSNSAWLKDL